MYTYNVSVLKKAGWHELCFGIIILLNTSVMLRAWQDRQAAVLARPIDMIPVDNLRSAKRILHS